MKKLKMFEGIYNSFNEIETHGEAFASEFWKSRETKRIKEALKMKPEALNSSKEYPLFHVASMALNREKDLRIIDFGGGLGKGFLSVSRGILDLKKLDYKIIEIQELCEIGKKIFEKEKELEFFTDFPPIQNVDVFHFGSCLQYIENWKELLKISFKYNPNYILFSDLLAGDIETFVTKQLMFDSTIPYQFLNISEFIGFIEDNNFNLRFRTNYEVKIQGEFQSLPTGHFPKNKQLCNSSNLLFINSKI